MLATVPSQPRISTYPSGFRHNGRSLTTPSSYTHWGRSLTVPGYRRKEKREIIWPWDVAGKKKIDYLVAMFHGRRGRGKSTGASAFSKYLLQGNQHLQSRNFKVYANYKVLFADMCHPRLIDWLVTFPKELHDCLLIVDEIAVYFPSVRATTTVALNFATWLQEIRKLRVELIFTTQFPTMLIGNLNVQVDLFIEPHRYNFVYSKAVKDYVANSVQLDCVDWWGQWSGMPVQHRWPPLPQDVICSPSLHNLQCIYPQFNTDEIVPAFWSPTRSQVLDREWEEEIQREQEQEEEAIEEHLAALREQHQPRKQAEATSVVDLLAQVDDREVKLADLLPDARKLDPGIKTYADLADVMRRHGWSCYQESGKYSPWLAERLKT